MIYQNILNLFSVIGGILGGGGLIGLLVWLWKSGKYFGTLEEKLRPLSSLQSNVAQLTNAMVEIQTHLCGRGFTINQKIAVTSSSPMKLTDFGEQMMQESGFYKILEANKEFFIDLVKAKDPKTNYDIQEYSFGSLKELAKNNNPIINSLKNYAYQKGFVLEIILQAAGIVLRDKIMEKLKFDDQTLEKEK